MLIYDCEIIKAIQGKDEARIPGIEYCDGWEDYENMGISVICAYEANVSIDAMSKPQIRLFPAGSYRVFMDDGDNFAGFRDAVRKHDLIVGFNNIKFDNRLCRANGIDVPDEKSYDILREVWAAAGLGPEYNRETHKNFGLDAICKANFSDLQKTGNGALAPVLWQRGHIGKLVDYCLQDVRLTWHVLTLIAKLGYILDPRDKTKCLLIDWPAIWQTQQAEV